MRTLIVVYTWCIVMLSCLCCFSVFFFQAEDGIRDRLVTGVQTCALPISYWQDMLLAVMLSVIYQEESLTVFPARVENKRSDISCGKVYHG